jgi:hypothetical protein
MPVTWMVLDLTTAKFKPRMLPVHCFSFGWSVKLLLGFISTVIHGFSKVKVKIMLQLTVSQQSFLVSSIHLWLKTRFLLLSDSCGFVDVRCPLWREDGSVIYNCCWLLPAQPFLDLSPAAPMTIFYCLRLQTPPTWRARSPYLHPPGTGWPSYTPRQWVPLSSPPTTCRAVKVKVILRPTVCLGIKHPWQSVLE